MSDSPLNSALRHFEATEANLAKAEITLADIESLIPQGVVFGDNPEYEEHCRTFDALITALPKLDGWKPDFYLFDLDQIAQSRLDAHEVGEIDCITSFERHLGEPARLLREYRHRFNQKRRELVRDTLIGLIDAVDANLRNLAHLLEGDDTPNETIEADEFDVLQNNVSQIATLIGSGGKPPRWGDLHRHLHFGMLNDLYDIIEHDWPAVKGALLKTMYGEREPVPVEVDDLGDLVRTKPTGPVTAKLKWEQLSAEDFERLVYDLISSTSGYENPQWLMKTNAQDRGRDLSVDRIYTDNLGGTIRHRVIIQCKHWLSNSISMSEIALLKEQMKLWEPPRVDVCIVATSGRFTSDAIAAIEKQNQSNDALRIEPWPESHLEHLLANRPDLIAKFKLR